MLDRSPDAPLPHGVPAPDETHLVERARSGDLNAFNQLVDLHQRLVFNLCLRMLGSSAPAEDATQDAFIAAWRNIDAFRGASFRAWLMRIAANACTDELRRRGRRPALSLDAPTAAGDTARGEPPDLPDRAPGPEDAALRVEQRRRIQAALLQLPDDQRLAVVLCDVQGFAYEEIAEAMRTSVGTVKSRIARGREKLRRLLATEHSGG
jgi:RNA polymerase sigma-70 factor (ECF subfamily)